MQWLSTEQALADIPYFAANFSRNNFPNIDFTPSSTPWIFIGGSYAGMRAAFVRNMYPDTIFASYASSAPVEARIDMSIYYEQVWRGMNAYGWCNCTKDIKAALNEMDAQMRNPFSSAALKQKFLGHGAEKNSNEGFADALIYPFYEWQSYGVEGGAFGLRSFCDWLETDPATNQTSNADGWASTKGAQFAIDRWASWPSWTKAVNTYTPTNCTGPSGNSSINSTQPVDCNLDGAFTDPASVSWTWQYCTQWGTFSQCFPAYS